MNILITGASGSIGRVVCAQLRKEGHTIIEVRHRSDTTQDDVANPFVYIDFGDEFDISSVLNDVDIVIHIAARVHIMKEKQIEPLNDYLQINTHGTMRLAKQANEANVKRFIFFSSIGVNGGISLSAFTEQDKANPRDDYSLSKYEAEQGLLQLAEKTNLEVVIIRPPLVYGPNVKANFASLIRLVNKSLPLPLGAVHNQRSLVALDNLVDFTIHCINHPAAANEVFVICDDEDVSTTTLLNKIAAAYNKKLYLLPIPVSVMSWAAQVIGKRHIAEKLFGNLQVDCTKAKQLLGWKPVITMDEQLTKMAEYEKRV